MYLPEALLVLGAIVTATVIVTVLMKPSVKSYRTEEITKPEPQPEPAVEVKAPAKPKSVRKPKKFSPPKTL